MLVKTNPRPERLVLPGQPCCVVGTVLSEGVLVFERGLVGFLLGLSLRAVLRSLIRLQGRGLGPPWDSVCVFF